MKRTLTASLGLSFFLATASLSHAQQVCVAKITADTPLTRFIANADGTVTDTSTKLMWKKCPEGQTGTGCGGGALLTLTWSEALAAAAASTFAGYTDWRAPDIKELQSIVERKCAYPAINLGIFPATPRISFWTSSINLESASEARAVDFDTGYSGYFTTYKNYKHHVRLVRNVSP
jgi:Protein of unknown function (DUF1566)